MKMIYMKKIEIPKSYWLECDCGTEAFQIQHWKESAEFYISHFCYGHKGMKYDWKSRLRHIWKIIRDGYPWADEIIVKYDDAVNLINYLKREMKDAEKERNQK